MEDERTLNVNTGRVTVGLLILGIGVLLLLDRTDVLTVPVGRFIAPFVLILLGSTRLAFGEGDLHRARGGQVLDRAGRVRRCGRHRFPGLWLILVGCWMLVTELHLWGLDYDTSWPLLIVAAGVMIVAGELARRQPDPEMSGTEQ
ncbi:MAG TPA: DUF5668 domain-containing protein [Vicinamibacterales bacterium]|nr:DUF5668 domain-containing protein [Vicinamibacterales bacterium]